MKAVIMAGGKGTRLRPVCDLMPKPMTRILGRPLMEHITELLKNNGFTEICVTLAHKPEFITEYFGDGGKFGVSMEYRIEETALGTAGGVRSCMDFTGDESFLVISGDAACDFDLRVLANEHKKNKAVVTMALYPHIEPLRYGTVLTDKSGRVISFIEKPSWERVVTDFVNTGVYMISQRAMKYVPEGVFFDFARDLFPRLLESGEKIAGLPMDGYWCDIGDIKSYLRCSMDALDGKLKLKAPPNSPQASIFMGFDMYERPQLTPPYVICEGATIERGAVIEHSVIHPSSRIGAYSRVINSVVDGANIAEACIVNGTVVCNGAKLYPQTVTRAGDVISSLGSSAPSASTELLFSPPRRSEGLCRMLSCDNRAKLMREISLSLWEAGADFSDGLLIKDGNCRVRIAPLAEESAISIEAIGGRESERLALCKKYSSLAESFGGKTKV